MCVFEYAYGHKRDTCNLIIIILLLSMGMSNTLWFDDIAVVFYKKGLNSSLAEHIL